MDSSNRKTFLLILVLAILVGVVGSIVLMSDGESEDTTESALLEGHPETAAPEGDPFGPVAPREAAGDLEEVVRALTMEIGEGQGPGGIEAQLSPLIVQVWDREEGVPAAQAKVVFIDAFDGPELRDPFTRHLSDLVEGRGQAYWADSQGRVTLPAVRDWAVVTAQRPGAFGFVQVKREHREVETITVLPDETVTIRVLDLENRPVAAAPVGVLQRVLRQVKPQEWRQQLEQLERRIPQVQQYIRNNPGIPRAEQAKAHVEDLLKRRDELSSNLRRIQAERKRRAARRAQRRGAERPFFRTSADLRAQRRTDADGFAVFHHFQIYRQQHEKWWPAEHVDRFEATLLLPLQEPDAQAFTGRPVPEDPIVLRLPATGSIALRTVDRDGRPFTHPVHAELRRRGVEVEPRTRVHVRKGQNEKAIVFPYVGLGLQFTAQCRLDDEDFRWSRPRFAGPGRAGERVTLDLVVAPNAGMLHGRLLDAAGEALAGVCPTFRIHAERGHLEGEEVTLDEAGRFHLPYKLPRRLQGPYRLDVRRDDVHPTSGLAKTLETLPGTGVSDLGDLRIGGLDRFASGAVVDDLDLPIAGAALQLQREYWVAGEQPHGEFRDETFTAAETDTEGRFELFADVEPGRLRLRAEARDHFPVESHDLEPGEQLELKLDRKSRIVGTVLKPQWLAAKRVEVRMESAIDPTQQRQDKLHDYEGKTYIFFDWVRAGTYNLSLRVQEFPDPFFRVDGVEIQPGQQGLHPQLEDLDLGAFLFRFELSAVDESGQKIDPKRPLITQIGRPDGSTGHVGLPWKDGRVEFLSASPFVEVLPLAIGYVAQPTTVTHGRRELRFLKIPPVILQAPGLRQLVGATPVLMLMELKSDAGLPEQLEKWDGASGRISGWYDGRMKYVSGLLGETSDSVPLELMCSGHYRLAALLGYRSGVRPVNLELGEADVHLVPGTGPQPVRANVDPERVQQGLAKLAQLQAASEEKGK